MFLFALISAVLVILLAVVPLRTALRWKILLGILCAAAAFKFQILHLFGGKMFFAPDLPHWILLATAWVYSLFLLFLLLLLPAGILWALLRLGLLIARRKMPEKAFRIRNGIHAGLLIVSGALTTWGIWQGTKIPEVREVTLPVLRPGQPELRAVLLADLHADALTRADHIRAIVEKTNALKPDTVLIAGDFVDGLVPDRGADLLPLRELEAPLGIYGVPGNHEYYSGYYEWLLFLEEKAAVRMLVNSSVPLREGIVLGGTADLQGGKHFGGEAPDVEKTFRGTDPGSLRILLAHQPKLAAEAAKNHVSLQLSGHTHGGMIRGMDLIVAAFNSGYVSGLYDVDGMKLYVSNGSGMWSGFPIRVGRPSEITLLRLTPAEK